jgi:hypothetical protein
MGTAGSRCAQTWTSSRKMQLPFVARRLTFFNECVNSLAQWV